MAVVPQTWFVTWSCSQSAQGGGIAGCNHPQGYEHEQWGEQALWEPSDWGGQCRAPRGFLWAEVTQLDPNRRGRPWPAETGRTRSPAVKGLCKGMTGAGLGRPGCMVVLGFGSLIWLGLGCQGAQWRLGNRLVMFL